jgi:nitrite reductase/ring-hydroxylating ferredoxin subunit
MNEAFTEVLSAAELPIGRIRAVKVDDRSIAISHTARGFFATDNSCPHRGGPLAEGDLIGDEIVCPWHLWGFNLQTGICDGNREISIAVHEVRVEDDKLLVRLSPQHEAMPSVL